MKRISLVTVYLFLFGTFSFSQNFPFNDIYLDTLANRFVEDLKKDGIRDYIIFSETDLGGLNSDNNFDCSNGKRALFILWEEDSIAYAKKFTECYEYDPVEINIKPIIEFMYENEDRLMKEKDTVRFNDSKNSFFKRNYNNQFLEPRIELVINYYEESIYLFTYKYDPVVIRYKEIFDNVLKKSRIKFVSKNKYDIDPAFIKRKQEDIAEKQKYAEEMAREWINTSIPISDDSLKLESRLVQEAYKLYEYLVAQDTFITGDKIVRYDKYFWVPLISLGQYEYIEYDNHTNLRYFNLVGEKSQQLKSFRPKSLKPGIKFLYSSEKIWEYFQSKDDEYGPLPGLFLHSELMMSGANRITPSPPYVSKIYFNKDFTEAFLDYHRGNTTYDCLISKKNGKWVLVKNVAVIDTD